MMKMKDDCDDSGESVQKGQEAIELLEKLIEGVEKGDLGGLTDRQALAMLRVAKVLIAAIDKETTVWESLVQSGSLAKLKSTMEKLIVQITETKSETDDKLTISETEAIEIITRRLDK